MRKLAFRYRRVKEMYNTYKNNVGGKCQWPGNQQGLSSSQKLETLWDISGGAVGSLMVRVLHSELSKCLRSHPEMWFCAGLAGVTLKYLI